MPSKKSNSRGISQFPTIFESLVYYSIALYCSIIHEENQLPLKLRWFTAAVVHYCNKSASKKLLFESLHYEKEFHSSNFTYSHYSIQAPTSIHEIIFTHLIPTMLPYSNKNSNNEAMALGQRITSIEKQHSFRLPNPSKTKLGQSNRTKNWTSSGWGLRAQRIRWTRDLI